MVEPDVDNISATLRKKISTREACIGILGLGYMGLPLAFEFAANNFSTVGIDINKDKINQLSQGLSYIDNLSNSKLKELLNSGNLQVTSDISMVSKMDCIIVSVPTPLRKTKDPDISCIYRAVQDIARFLKKGHLVVLESTTYPGTTEELVLPFLEKTGLRVGQDFFLSYAPERVDPGNKEFTIRNTPKIVGGITESCTELTTLLFEQIIEEVVTVNTPREAEMVKLLENTFRSINIGLVNELALMSDRMGIDIWRVVDAAATKPFGFMPFYPGPGLGGHCIPIDPFYLSWKARTFGFYTRFIETAGEINGNMPRFVVYKLMDVLNTQGKCFHNAKIFVLGITYKRDIGDSRESPALGIVKLLRDKGATINYNDPFVPTISLNEGCLHSLPVEHPALGESDCVVILTDHSCYDYKKIVSKATLVFDTRNATRDLVRHREKIIRL